MSDPSPRIYWLTEEFFPPQIGGVELMAANLSRGLTQRGLATQVITRQTQPRSASEEHIDGVRVRRVPPAGQIKGSGWRAAPRMLRYLTGLALLLIREARQYDIVIVSGMKIIPLAAVPVCRLLQRRCVIRVESTYELVEPLSAESLRVMRRLGALLHAALAKLQRLLLAHADAVIVISAEVEQLLRAGGLSPARFARIPNAVDTDKFRPATASERNDLRRRLGLPVDRTILLYAGRLSRAKGVPLLVDAAPELIARHPGLCIIIVGSGKGSFDDCEAELVEAIRANSLGQDVHMWGPADRVHDYMRAADIAIFPSHYEGFGVGLIEALATGVPVVATPVGIARELVREAETGFVFSPGNRRGLVAAIEAALNARPGWSDLGRRERLAVEPYALERIVTEYEALCRRLCGAAPR